MKRWEAMLVVGGLLLLTTAAMIAPLVILCLFVLVAAACLRPGRTAFLVFVATSLPINVLLLALFAPGAGGLTLGPIRLGAEGALLGLVGGLRLAAALGANLAALSWVHPTRILDGLRLPERATSLLAAVLLAAHDVGRDLHRLRTARRLEGGWPTGRIARAREASRLLPALLLSSHKRARVRADALRLAGHDTAPWFVPVVAVASLAAAGRMAFLALPNITPAYAVIFLGGLLFGPWVAFAGACLGMLVTDFFLTGFYPLSFVNVPAMGLIGLMGGWTRRFDFVGGSKTDRTAGMLFAASAGIVGTMLFSAAADVLTWAIALRGASGALLPIVLAGLAFNVVPSLVNGFVFAATVAPMQRAYRAMTADSAAPDPPLA